MSFLIVNNFLRLEVVREPKTSTPIFGLLIPCRLLLVFFFFLMEYYLLACPPVGMQETRRGKQKRVRVNMHMITKYNIWFGVEECSI